MEWAGIAYARKGVPSWLSKEIIELLIVADQPINDKKINAAELQLISVFFTEILAEMLQYIEQDKE